MSVQEAGRKALFQEQWIPFTKGDVSLDFKQITKEQRLISMITDDASEPLRQLRFEQSEAFIRNVDQVVDSLGGTKEAGEVLKGALEGRLNLLKKEKGDLYKQFSETAPELKNIPIITDTIFDAIPPKQTVRRIERSVPGPVSALDDILVEFGVNTDAAKVKKFIDAGDDITPLDIGKFEDFRQGINLIERVDQTSAIKVLTGPVKRALDNEAGLIDDAVKAAGVADEGVLAPIRKARETVRAIKTEFSAESITGKLVKFKRDGVTPVVEASKALDQIIGFNKPIENLERVLTSLNKAGKDGKTAIQAIQASVILRALDDALKAPTRKLGDTKTKAGTHFQNRLIGLGLKN